MRNIVMENDPDWEGIPQKLKEILTTRFIENRSFFYGFSDTMKNNPVEGQMLLDAIEDGDNVIGQTNFHEKDQIEKFIHVMKDFMRKKKHINFYTVLSEEIYGTMEEAFARWLRRPNAINTPAAVEKIAYKAAMNELLKQCLEYHKLYRMVSADPEDDKLLTYEGMLLTAPAQSA
jgi:hypothetical protein